MSAALSYGDMVRIVADGQQEIGQGVIVGGRIDEQTLQLTTVTIDHTYGDGWHKDHLSFTTVGDADVELIEKGWHRKWQRRHYGRSGR